MSIVLITFIHKLIHMEVAYGLSIGTEIGDLE